MFEYLRSLFGKRAPAETMPITKKQTKSPSSKREKIIKIMQERRRGYGVHVSRKLSRAWRREAAQMWHEGKTATELAAIFCVSISTAEEVVRAEKSKQKTNAVPAANQNTLFPMNERQMSRDKIIKQMQSRVKGSGVRPDERLSREWRREAALMYLEGMTPNQIAQTFHVHETVARKAIRTAWGNAA